MSRDEYGYEYAEYHEGLRAAVAVALQLTDLAAIVTEYATVHPQEFLMTTCAHMCDYNWLDGNLKPVRMKVIIGRDGQYYVVLCNGHGNHIRLESTYFIYYDGNADHKLTTSRYVRTSNARHIPNFEGRLRYAHHVAARRAYFNKPSPKRMSWCCQS